MDSGMNEVPSGFSPENNSAVIAEMMQRDSLAFSEWVASKSTTNPQLDIPNDALRYLISQRAYELADDPVKLDLRVMEESPAMIRFLIVEKKAEHLSDPTRLKQLRGLTVPTSRPPDIDEQHWEFIDEVLEGSLHSDDFVITGFDLKKVKNNVLKVISYSDRDSLQGKGLATGQYERLRLFAQQLGFRFITGQNSEVNISFFKDKLGRVLLSEIEPRFYAEFMNHPLELEDIDPGLFTVDFLNPDDRDTFLIKRT